MLNKHYSKKGELLKIQESRYSNNSIFFEHFESYKLDWQLHPTSKKLISIKL